MADGIVMDPSMNEEMMKAGEEATSTMVSLHCLAVCNSSSDIEMEYNDDANQLVFQQG